MHYSKLPQKDVEERTETLESVVEERTETCEKNGDETVAITDQSQSAQTRHQHCMVVFSFD